MCRARLGILPKKFSEDLKDSMAAFEAARLFLPSKIIELKPDLSAVDKLKAFPFLNSKTVLDRIKQELPLYLAKAADTEITFLHGKKTPLYLVKGCT